MDLQNIQKYVASPFYFTLQPSSSHPFSELDQTEILVPPLSVGQDISQKPIPTLDFHSCYRPDLSAPRIHNLFQLVL